MFSSRPKKLALSIILSIKNNPRIITGKKIMLAAPLECLSAAVQCPYSTPQAEGSVGLEVELKTKLQS